MTQAPENMQIFRPYRSEMMAPTGAVTIEPLRRHPINLSLSRSLSVSQEKSGHGGVKVGCLHVIERGNTSHPKTSKLRTEGRLEVGHGGDASNERP
jgi:hypothetical protein